MAGAHNGVALSHAKGGRTDAGHRRDELWIQWAERGAQKGTVGRWYFHLPEAVIEGPGRGEGGRE